MINCVRIDSREFKTLLDEVNIPSSALELIIHKIQNSENSDRFPSAEEVNNLLKPKSFTGDYNMIEVWEKQYSSPINFPTLTLANEEYNNAAKIFGKDSISIVERKNGTYDLMVGNPTFESEYKYILSNAKRDSEGNLLAPNGKKSNLNERQYAQVRTKAFKEWFGDWENDPENASKVVDENGEPLVVYHGSKNGDFDIFNYTYLRKADSGFFFTSDKEYAKQFENTREFFLNIKNPNLTNVPLNIDTVETLLTVDYIEGTDGIQGHDDTNTNENLSKSKGQEYVAIRSNQIKSATDNIGTFSTTDNNVRHSSVTERPIKVPSVTSFAERLQVQQQPKFASLVARGEISTSCR